MIGDPATAFGDFEAAIRHDADNPDIYYHRGQGTLCEINHITTNLTP